MSLRPDDLFDPSGHVRASATDAATMRALRDSLRHARATNWDSVRTPHLFMGLLSAPDPGVFNWATRLSYDTAGLFKQFHDLFYQHIKPMPPLQLNREFLSDNVLRLLRDALARAGDHGRRQFTQMDLLISLFAAPNSIVAECFEQIGVTAASLTESAVLAEQDYV